MPNNRKPIRVVNPGPVTHQPPDRSLMGVHIFDEAARGLVISRVWEGDDGSTVDDILLSDLPHNIQAGVRRFLDRLASQ